MIKKIVLACAVLGCSLSAGGFGDKSLIGIEGGYSGMGMERTAPTEATLSSEHKSGHLGLKIGAEAGNYRLFLSTRYFNDNDFDYITTYGVEGQYLFNVSKSANFFIGINGGMANMKFMIPNESFSRTISDAYYGGDVGFNIHAAQSVDVELGTRIMDLQFENRKNSVSYIFESMVSAYVSLIYKFQMN
ncbi:MAG: outer membrane beta-barrel protein [Campylobacterales bacterium]|nr:outer membrane beta-barrel protein [Campylobacterales bacterium]